MYFSSIFLFLFFLHYIDTTSQTTPDATQLTDEVFESLQSRHIQDLSCLVGICVVAEGCEGSPMWRRVFEWPVWDGSSTGCLHAFMIRRNIDPSVDEKNEIRKVLGKYGEEYFIVMASGGPEGPAREMRLETSMLNPIFAVTHDGINRMDKRKNREKGMKWTIDSYDYQNITKDKFEAGILTRIKYVNKWDDFCIFIHSSRSIQHLCGGLERLFQQIPSNVFPMKTEECQDTFDTTDIEKSIEIDKKSGFFKCKSQLEDEKNLDGPPKNEDDDPPKIKDDVLWTKTKGYVKLHYAFCRAGKTAYLVEDPKEGFFSLKFTKAHKVKCGHDVDINDRCQVPEIPDDVKGYCEVRCDKGGKTVNPTHPKQPNILRCDFMDSVIDGKRYKKNTVPEVTCDPTGWWKYSEPGNQRGISKWVKSMYCFFPQSGVYSDCILDRFECDSKGECPNHRAHQVDCDGNTEGLVLAVFHPSLQNGYSQVNTLGCDTKNGWWTVDGKALPSTAIVDCVWPFELEIMKRDAEMEEWEPDAVEPRAISEVGRTVRIAAVVVAVASILVVIIGIIVVNTRLQGPKTRIVTRQLRSLYPSLLNEEERNDPSKAEAEYKSVDCEAAGLALHQIYKQLEGESTLELHTHWISLSWPKRNLLLERTLLHRAFFGIKVLYNKFKMDDNDPQTFDLMRPGLSERIVKASKQYKSFTEKWTPHEQLYSLAFATLSKAELDAFRRNEVKRKYIRPQPPKDQNSMDIVQTDAPGTDFSNKKIPTEASTPVANTANAPTLDDTGTATAGVSTGKGDTGGSTGKGASKEKIEETTAPPPEKE